MTADAGRKRCPAFTLCRVSAEAKGIVRMGCPECALCSVWCEGFEHCEDRKFPVQEPALL